LMIAVGAKWRKRRMLQDKGPDVKLRRRSRPLLLVVAGLLLAFCLAGAGTWFVAAQMTAKALDQMIAEGRAQGQALSCPNRRMSGFPFALELSCDGPSFAGLISGKPTKIQIKALRASLRIFNPREIAIAADPPFELRSEDSKSDLSVTWSSLELVAGGLPEAVSQVSFRGQGLAIGGVLDGLGNMTAQAARVGGSVTRSPEDQNADSYDFHVTAIESANPRLASIIGARPISEFKADGRITQASFDLALLPAETMEHWRSKGGRIDFSTLSISQGETRVSAHGTLALDAGHRPQGRLDTESVGIEPLLRRYGINPSLATAGMLLSSLLGGGNSPAAEPNSPAGLRLPLRLDNGAVIIGPVQTGIHLPPLY
jgi:hypothetical protein